MQKTKEEKTTSHVNTVLETIFEHFKIEVPDLRVPADLFTFTKEILKENITQSSARVNKTSLRLELHLKIKSQFQKTIFSRDFDLMYALLLPPGMEVLKIVAI